jgi:pimeloyl-ACP methyl ester carboxylesterase
MFDERAFLSDVETASPEHFGEILRTANLDQQRALRAYFGTAKLERLRVLAQRQVTRGTTRKKGRVAILPGILGSQLNLGTEEVWFGFWNIVRGEFGQLDVDGSGTSIHPVDAPAALRRYYGEIEQYLLREWDVLVVPFDWRLDIRTSADVLAERVRARFGSTDDVHLVAHSMGGLVARSLAHRKPEIWASMGRLIMLGTPNFGSLAIPQLYTGLYRLMRIVAALDLEHSLPELLQLAKMFVGTYQMLPRPDKLTNTTNPEKLFDPSIYGTLHPPRVRFDDARLFQAELDAVLDAKRLTYIAGSNQPTPDGVADWSQLGDWEGYNMTALGDGTVPHSLGVISNVLTYYVEEEHSRLPANMFVLEAVNSILENGSAAGIAEIPPVTRGTEADLRKRKRQEDESAVVRADELKQRVMAMRGAYENSTIAPEEHEIADLAFTGRTDAVAVAASAGTSSPRTHSSKVTPLPARRKPPAKQKKATREPLPVLRVRVCCGRIEDVGAFKAKGTHVADLCPVDAIAVGHYIGVQPINAEMALDTAISASLGNLMKATAAPAGNRASSPESEDAPDNGVITQFTQRGIVRGELGRPFFLPDPRDPNRLIVIAGMGSVGTFGPSELTVLARELFWSLARLGKKHLATILIGSGAGNLEIPQTVRAWLRGAALAIVDRPDQSHIEEISFIEIDTKKAKQISTAVSHYKQLLHDSGLDIHPLPQEEITVVRKGSGRPKQMEVRDGATGKPATRILIEMQDNVYRFGAVTESASFPERISRPDPKLVMDFNDNLAGQPSLDVQREWGESLFKLLFPEDLQQKLTSNNPVVIACDSNVAQLHLELLVNPELASSSTDYENAFFGLSRGITRQLRNNFAGPPEPPPPSTRMLRVLIVADTDYKRPLPGAAEEAQKVKQLFESHGKKLQESGSKLRIHVDSLIGPNEAKCAQVLKALLKYPPYDILHYSGHCDYVEKDPPSSGWLFSGNRKLSANELSRVDRVPSFVFSNACESGVTPSRPDLRSPQLAPSFAEAFFDRGVKNFVCTAWPVWDDAATRFAVEFYSWLLGLHEGGPAYMYEAMRQARLAIYNEGSGVETWGAYQHYGNPWFKLF